MSRRASILQPLRGVAGLCLTIVVMVALLYAVEMGVSSCEGKAFQSLCKVLGAGISAAICISGGLLAMVLSAYLYQLLRRPNG